MVEVVLHEGRKHIVRRMLEAVGHPVETLVRVQVGPIRLGDLKSGRTRRLTPDEVGQLYSTAGM
jgi:23S rRNA pseudouridine2605 synthase